MVNKTVSANTAQILNADDCFRPAGISTLLEKIICVTGLIFDEEGKEIGTVFCRVTRLPTPGSEVALYPIRGERALMHGGRLARLRVAERRGLGGQGLR